MTVVSACFFLLVYNNKEPPNTGSSRKTVFFACPARLRGKRTSLDFERALGVQGTARSARVVGQLLARLSPAESKSGRGAGRGRGEHSSATR